MKIFLFFCPWDRKQQKNRKNNFSKSNSIKTNNCSSNTPRSKNKQNKTKNQAKTKKKKTEPQKPKQKQSKSRSQKPKQKLNIKRKKQTNHLKTSLKKHENFFVFFVPGPENNKKIEKINFQNQMQSKHITAAP